MLGYILTVFMGFFAMMNPIANVPIFLSLTEHNTPEDTRAIARQATGVAFFIVLAFAIAGNVIFQVFGISLNAFQITGGILVFSIGFHMLQGHALHPAQPEGSEEGGKTQEAALSVAVSPLATPILAGPGIITTTMNFSGNGGWLELCIVMSCFAALCLMTYGFFIFGRSIVAFVGHSALGVITRMMGLILAVMGTQMLLEGIQGVVQTYERPPINQQV